MNRNIHAVFIIAASLLLLFGCSKKTMEMTELKYYPVDSMEGIITGLNVEIDKTVTSDGGGSLKVTTGRTTVVRLYETGDLDVENARLFYRAKVRTENVKGKAYLEMWVQFGDKGEFFSRDLQSPLA
ncbi:MAG: hypothetical protein ABIH66_09030, partial [bacterium]